MSNPPIYFPPIYIYFYWVWLNIMELYCWNRHLENITNIITYLHSIYEEVISKMHYIHFPQKWVSYCSVFINSISLMCKKIEYQNVFYPIANCSQISSLVPKHTISILIYFKHTISNHTYFISRTYYYANETKH